MKHLDLCACRAIGKTVAETAHYFDHSYTLTINRRYVGKDPLSTSTDDVMSWCEPSSRGNLLIWRFRA